MLDQALLFVRDLLDAHLRRRLGVNESIVILNHLGGTDGSLPQKNQNHLVITLVMLEYETAVGFSAFRLEPAIKKRPPQRFNLSVLLAAQFDDYAEALKVLSEAILFFQASPVLLSQDIPYMPPGLTALLFELENTTEAKAFEMWSALGARYLPSVRYKIRHVTLDADQIREVSPLVETVDVGGVS